MTYCVILVLITSEISTKSRTKRNQQILNSHVRNMLSLYCCYRLQLRAVSFHNVKGFVTRMPWFCVQPFIANRCFVCFVYLHLLTQFIWVFLREQIKGRCVFFFFFFRFSAKIILGTHAAKLHLHLIPFSPCILAHLLYLQNINVLHCQKPLLWFGKEIFLHDWVSFVLSGILYLCKSHQIWHDRGRVHVCVQEREGKRER